MCLPPVFLFLCPCLRGQGSGLACPRAFAPAFLFLVLVVGLTWSRCAVSSCLRSAVFGTAGFICELVARAFADRF